MLQITNKDLSTQEATILVVIDPQVAAPESLVSGIKTNTKAVLLDPNQDRITQITTLLAQGNYTTLHLISHGSPGCLHLGETKLTTENLSQYNQQLLEWGIREILVYGCNVAAAPELLRQLHYLTGATIAASTKEVGKGNWTLEWQIGEIKSELAFNSQIRQEYPGTFAFEPQVTVPVGNGPQGVAIGDFNGDGDSDDIVVSNYYGGNISVLLADGSGGFTSTTLPSSGFDFAVGDFNEDGTDDFAVVDFGDVSVFLSDGSGSFTGPTNFTAGAGPVSVAVGDFNNDDNLDLAVSNQNTRDVSTFLGDGSGGFTASTTVAVGSQATFVAVGDLDGDGEVDDIVVARRLAGSVSVFLGDNSGGFSARTDFSTGIGPTGVAIGDLDGDGAADDIAVSAYYDDSVSVLLNDGSGGFLAQTTFAAGDNTRKIVIGDFDADGAADDIAAINRNDDNVSVLLNDGSGSFEAQTTFAVGDNPYSLAVGDLDGDGVADDLAVSNQNDNTVSVLIECFLTGTHILTEQGEVAVENLQIGDQVQTAEGQPETIKWIGKQTIETHQVKNPLRGYPVLIKAGALGNNLPHQDLYVSPDHAMFIDGLLINAGALVNDISIIKTEPNETFTYYHVELENHALLIAEGTAAESYLPQKENREQYNNFAEYQELYPNGSNLMLWPMDYPRISSCNKVPRFVSQKLMAIAKNIVNQDLELTA